MLFKQINILDENLKLQEDCYVAVRNGKIVSISAQRPAGEWEREYDGRGKLLMSGFYNAHAHSPMTLMRGYGENLKLQDWLNKKIFPFEAKLDGNAVYWGTMLALAESFRFGIVSTSDMYYFCDEICQAVAESGIKANISRGTSMFLGDDFCFDTFPACQELVALKDKWHNYDNGRIKIEASIHAEYTSTYQLWDALAEYAVNNGLQLQVHLSETKKEHDACVEKYGLTPAQVLDCHHVFDVPTVAAHCVHVTQEDMQLLAKRHVSAAHCPVSNLKLASGCADVLGMVRAGMNVCLGTDSVASNNNLDLFEEIKAAALMAKGKTGDPKALPAEAALMMATVCGARAQGRSAECGVIELGMDADLILLDFNQPHLIPCHNVLSHLVYAASGHDVALTMVRGKILYADGKYPTLDIAGALKELHDYAIPRVFSDEPEAQA